MKTNEDNPHISLRTRLLNSLLQPVPAELAICEFHCSKTECSAEEWKQCRRRLESLSVASLVTARNGS